jgi:ubiquinone/menaquinone biosynthesis C-methylase UbiE
LTIFTDNTIQGNFEDIYSRLRQQEGRIYSDAEVAQLPEISNTHRYFKEWQVRKQSSQRLIEYLEKKQLALNNAQYLKILEIGCGNGWLSHRLSQVPKTKVLGADINFSELQQAGRVFYKIPNLHFIYSNAGTALFKENQFDEVIFAASIQYFASFPGIIQRVLKLLKPPGEIHIIDSPLYTAAELPAAKQRSLLYYQEAGFPEMAGSYFHHCIEDLNQFNFTFLYDPTSLANKLFRNKNPFYWIRIRQ